MINKTEFFTDKKLLLIFVKKYILFTKISVAKQIISFKDYKNRIHIN